MRKLVLEGDASAQKSIILDEETSRYLAKVLRKKKGDVFDATDGSGNRYECQIEICTPNRVEITIKLNPLSKETMPLPSCSTVKIALIQGLPKGQKMDSIIRQATELGVSDIIPLAMHACVTREMNKDDKDSKRLRREKIVKEAMQQSGSDLRTRIHPATTLGELPRILESLGYGSANSLLLMFHELPLAEKSLHEYCSGCDRPVAVLVGPEGGYVPEETKGLLEMGFLPVHLAGSILRTETAAICAIASVKVLIMEQNSWSIST
jgi:16S rRNA (uracil1498-N3)-methyltransferase